MNEAEVFTRSSLFRAILRDQHKDVIKQIIADAYENDKDFREAMGG